MELKDFVSGTIIQIVEAVENANKALNHSSAEVNPKFNDHPDSLG